MNLKEFLLNAYNDVAVIDSSHEPVIYIKYDIDPTRYFSTDFLNRKIKAIKAGDGVLRVILEKEEDIKNDNCN